MTIRPFQPGDLEQVVELYRTRLVNSTFAKLGNGFLRVLMAGIDHSPHGVVLVDAEENTVRGFIAAATDVAALFAWLKGKRGLALAGRAAVGLVRRPNLLPRLWRTGGYFDEVGAGDIKAELLYIAVRTELARSKLSSKLLAAMLRELHARQAPAVKVTCEAQNESPQYLLRAFGFKPRREFEFFGKPMVLYAHENLGEARDEA